MLKPKKELFRKEIKRDPFLETMDKAESHFENHRSSYMKMGLAVAVGILLIKVYFNNNKMVESSSNTAMGEALVALYKGDVQNAKFQMETIMNEHENSNAGQIVGYYLGKIAYEVGDNEKAQDYLSEYIKKKPVDILIPPAKLMLAHIAVKNDNYHLALSYLDEGIALSKDEHRKRLYNLEKAKIILKYGDDKSGARSIVDDIYNQDGLNPFEKQIAEELLGRMSS